MYDPGKVRTFYDAYAGWEWSRLEASPYGRLQAVIHGDFIRRYVKSGDRVLDAGCGPGRFSILATQLGARVTCLDISLVQLQIARQKFAEAGVPADKDTFIEGDIADLSRFQPGSFDVVICFGGALTYVCENRHRAAAELRRVTRSGGVLLVSVMSRLGAVLGNVRIPSVATLERPGEDVGGEPALWPVLNTGDLLGFHSPRAGMRHPAMHLYTAAEIAGLFADCTTLELAGSCVTLSEYWRTPDELAQGAAWTTIVELERRLCTDPGLVNSGTHIILATRK